MQDEQIVELLWERKENGLRELENKYGIRIQNFAKKFLSEEDALECVNDTYMAVWESIPPHRPEFLLSYVVKICRNLALNKIEWNEAAKRKATIVELSTEIEQCIPGNSLTMQQEEFGKVISQFLRGLSREKRQIFVKRYWYNSSIKELADWSGYSESKIKSILFRVRKELRHFLEKEGIEV